MPLQALQARRPDFRQVALHQGDQAEREGREPVEWGPVGIEEQGPVWDAEQVLV